MTRSGDVWNIDGDSYLKDGQANEFIMSGRKQVESVDTDNAEYFSDLFRYFPGNQYVTPVKDYATFSHLDRGGEITFDPTLY